MEKRLLWTAVLLFLTALLAACGAVQNEPSVAEEEEIRVDPTDTPELEVVIASLENFGPAPEIENEVWLNTDQPIPLSSVEGKVVLLEFWTFG